jgi:outer membrane protein assembly factor BamB
LTFDRRAVRSVGMGIRVLAPVAGIIFFWSVAACDDVFPAGPFWPQFHGPRRDNISAETGLLADWPEGGPKLLWTFPECGAGYAAPSIAEGRIFTTGDFGGEEMVLALDLDGKLLWKRPSGPAWRGSAPGARATPTWVEGVVYQMGPTGFISAVRAATGAEVWAVDARKRFGSEGGAWALAENVLVEGKMVLCTPGGEKGRIVALDRETGATVWANTEIDEPAAYCSPVIATRGGVRIFITLMLRSVVGIDVATGKLLWKQRHKTSYDLNATAPVLAGDRFFIASGYGTGGRLFEIAPDGGSIRQIWSAKDLDNCHTGVLLIDGHLYGSGCRQSKKGFACVDLARGSTVWTDKEIWKVSLAWAEGRFYCYGFEGRVSLLEAGPAGAKVKGAFQMPSKDIYDCLAHPVVCGGRLYIRHGDFLYVYDVRPQ